MASLGGRIGRGVELHDPIDPFQFLDSYLHLTIAPLIFLIHLSLMLYSSGSQTALGLTLKKVSLFQPLKTVALMVIRQQCTRPQEQVV